MLFKIGIFVIGFGLTTVGLVYIIAYLNLLTLGYNFIDYVNFIIRRIECLNTILGMILMNLSIYLGGKNELRI